MFIQEKISDPDTLLKLSVAIDEGRKVLHPPIAAKQFSRDPRGRVSTLSATERLALRCWRVDGDGTIPFDF